MNLNIIFITENEKGNLPRDIFEECGFDVEVLGIDTDLISR